MDEAAIRRWAWDQMENWGKTVTDAEGKTDFKPFNTTQRLEAADRLAAWVMDGKIRPEPAV